MKSVSPIGGLEQTLGARYVKERLRLDLCTP